MRDDVLWIKLNVTNAKECLQECTSDENCNYWDMEDGNCRKLSTYDSAEAFGYESALAGPKNCVLRSDGPKGIFAIPSRSLLLLLLLIQFLLCNNHLKL